MKESTIENYLKQEIEKRNGVCYKWVSPNNGGVPDRICVIPDFGVFFVELKAPGKKPRVLQAHVIDRLIMSGAYVSVIDSKPGVDSLMRYIDMSIAHNRYVREKNDIQTV